MTRTRVTVAGIAVAAALGFIDWPVALVLAGAHVLFTQEEFVSDMAQGVIAALRTVATCWECGPLESR